MNHSSGTKARLISIVVACGISSCALKESHPDTERLIPDGTMIAHALGGIDGVAYSNSLEAFRANYAAGKSWFEVDLALTADGHLVCFHSGHERFIGLETAIELVSTRDFLNHQYLGRYTLLTFRELLSQVSGLPGVYLVTDTKEWTPTILDALLRDLHAAPPPLRTRVIPQIYNPEDLRLLSTVKGAHFPFPFLIFTLYQTRMTDTQVLSFVKTSRIPVVTMSTLRFNASLARTLHQAGVKIFVHSINTSPEVVAFTEAGADGFYTDFYLHNQ